MRKEWEVRCCQYLPLRAFGAATNIVIPNKKAAGRAIGPRQRRGTYGFEKVAIKPKGTLSASKPIHWVSTNRSQCEVSESSFDQP